MNCIYLKYCQSDGSEKELLHGLIPTGGTQKILNGLITQV